MSHAIPAGMSRRQLLEAAGTAAAAVAAMGFAGQAEAATPAVDVMPLKATFTARFQSLTIPLDLPIIAQLVTGTGDSNLLGKITVAAHRTIQLDPNGQQLWSGANPGVFTNDSGDALFWSTGQLPNGFLVTGGRGRFSNAVGSGTIKATPNPATGEITFVWDGMIQVPKR